MRFNKQLIGIAAVTALAAGLATMDGASAGSPANTTSGTQLEYAQLPSTTTLIVEIVNIALGV